MKVNKIVIFISLAVLIGGSFYFFEYVPSKIQKDCSNKLLAWSVRAKDSDLYNKYFKQCINSGGYQMFSTIIKDNLEKEEEVKQVPQPVQIETMSDGNL